MHEKYMLRAIKLSKKGIGYTNPNPLVGSVIVKDDWIIGEGYHKIYGGNHAEIEAFNNAVEDVQGATMYVTLEPCSHYGKTPPCANAIVKKGIAKVVIGMKDPNELVSGRGIEILESNGIEVVTGICEEKIRKLNEIFIKYITSKNPFCIIKTAMTLDGKIATSIGDSKWISNEKSREYVHKIRHKVSSIMVGIGTILSDDPMLTTRLNEISGVDPMRIVIDTYARIPLESNVLNLDSKAKTIIATTEKAPKNKLEKIKEKGAQIIMTPIKKGRVDLKYLMRKLGEEQIDSVLLEGGSTLNYSALEEGIVDKVISFISPTIIGGEKAKTPVGGKGKNYIRDGFNLTDINILRFEEDIMVEGYVRKEE